MSTVIDTLYASGELEESLRERLEEAERWYRESPSHETHRIYSRILKAFTALVVRDTLPREQAGQAWQTE